jgi:hypothetical protein
MNNYAVRLWEAKEWESYVNDLLRLKHGTENYIPIPDSDGGDGGIEGYSLNGNAYQSYCPDEYCRPAELAEKQIKKIRTDIFKFINNESKLKKLLGNTKIKRWVLMVPRHQSKELVAYATKKTAEVVSKNLSYVDSSGFHILIWSLDEFKAEQVELISKGLHKLRLDIQDVPECAVVESENTNSEFLQNITRKLLSLPNADEQNMIPARRLLVKSSIETQNTMLKLQENYPQQYSQIEMVRRKREKTLKLEMISAPRRSLLEQIEHLSEHLQEGCNVHADDLDHISQGMVGDWLLRCDLEL